MKAHLGWIHPPLLSLLVRQIFPLKHQVPIEPWHTKSKWLQKVERNTTSSKVSTGPNVLEVVHADHVDDGADHTPPVLHHAGQQRLQPVLIGKSLPFHFRKTAS